MKIHAYPRLHANMKFLYGPHTFTLPGFEGPRADVETRDDVAGNRDPVRRPGGDCVPDNGASQVTEMQFYALLVIAVIAALFAIRWLTK
jgi:hypothetical protein